MTVHVARRLPVQLGPAAWNALLEPREQAEELIGNHTADFVVVGAGFAGLSAARRLTQLQPTARITVLEAGRLAEGAAGRNSGFMIDLPHHLDSDDYAGTGDEQSVIALNRHAIEFARKAVEEYGIQADYFDECGKVNGAATAAAHDRNQSYARHLQSLGEASAFLDARQMRDLTGSRYYIAGLYTPGTVMLQPAGYIRAVGKGLSADGVRIYENSAVLDFQRQGRSWCIRTRNGSVVAPRVVLTVNGHLESFGFERRRLIQLFLYATMTPALDDAALARLGGSSRWGITPSDPMGTTVRRIDTNQGGNRIVTRTCATLRPNAIPSESELKRARYVMQRKFNQRFPQLKGMRMEHSWAGHLCLSLNGVAVMREIDDGVYAGCVQNGLGTTRGTLTGIGAAELACGASSKITEHFGSEARPKLLLPQPLTQIGGNALLRWKEWRARKE